MIALTVSDMMEADDICLRISDIVDKSRTGAPDAIAVRNDSFSEEPFCSVVQLVSRIWTGDMVLESNHPDNISKALVHIMDRKPVLIGADANNLDGFAMTAKLFNCPLCVSSEGLEELFELVRRARESGVESIVLDPMMRNMKQCLETCTDIKRLSEIIPEAGYPIAVRTWSGEYAMTMATVSLLIDDAVVVADDLDADSCETLSVLMRSIR